MRQAWSSILLFLMIACGDHSSVRFKVDSKHSDNSIAPKFDIDEGWHIHHKTCGEITTENLDLESYRFDDQYFVRIQKLSEDEVSLCKVGYVYERSVKRFKSTSSVYLENALLRPLLQKQTCWKKENGELSDHATSDHMFAFDGLPSDLILIYDGSMLSIELNGMSDCPTRPLKLELYKK